VDEAARVLGLSVDAIRKRVQRGTIPYEKDPAGRVTILLDTVETVQDITGRGQDAERLLEDLREQVAFLRRELEAERNAHAETRRITYTLAQRVPELAPPRDEPHGPETVTEEPEGTDASTDRGGRETGVQRRSWWRRFFGVE
jgi:hypothetical protein